MTDRKLASLALVLVALAVACEAETGPDAPKRTNGCIDIGCGSSSSSSSSGDPDAGGPDAS